MTSAFFTVWLTCAVFCVVRPGFLRLKGRRLDDGDWAMFWAGAFSLLVPFPMLLARGVL